MPADLRQAIGFLLGVWIALTLLGPLGARGASGAEPIPGLEARLHDSVNRWRTDRHLVPLQRDPALDAVARRHSADMAARGYFSHQTPEGANPVDRILAGGVRAFSLAGENVGMTSRPNPNAEVFGGWLRSPDHYENLSAPVFNTTGIGIVRRPDGTLFYTQVYVTFPR